MYKIYINPGHCPGIDPGAVGYGVNESDIALTIGNKVKQYLETAGYEVRIYQADDLNGICYDANSWGADVFVSIHCNAFNGVAKGTESLHYPGSTNSIKLARCIQDQLINTLHTVDRGLKERSGLAVLRGTDMPATLIETAFIDQVDDNKLLVNNTDDFARAIAKGITDYIAQVYGTTTTIQVESTPVIESIVKPEYVKDTNTNYRAITPEDIAYFVSTMLIETGVEGNFNDVTKSSISDAMSIGCSQWTGDRADELLRLIPGGNQFVGKSYSEVVGEGKIYELKAVLNTAKGQQAQLDLLKRDCLKYVNELRQVWWLDDTRCLIYAATWATTSVITVRKFIEYLRGHINIRSLLELTNAFASQYRSFFGVDEKYQLGYSNRAWNMYYAVAAINLTTEYGIPEYGKGEFGR